MIKGIGIDITEIERWKNKSTHTKVFTQQELIWAKDNMLNYSILWCIKEATVKAIGTGFRKNIMWNDIEVLNIDGEYEVNLSHAAKQLFQINKHDQFHIDVTRSDNSVMSQVIWTDNNHA
ncbi:4'-phosphopantetheinyl transferase superfamily protein [Bacillus sp. Xin]|uniref:holo-ACP synthase n=1 Tax=unclassified Bacillus (in: firmicutes) TaxID=185979 RepID=UPI0015738A66|nr:MULTISPECIES: 4'-phosphopantetheinyl transferase superfamily protein [unclassified Bacillus (in: firmicutes)]MBC6975074.1 4'-phosphopantetheinyl transferase superfamily protein [Bacillus sp. Xin]NSW39462.1 4'-phosphopantetheinyl transferase superfamily protein [Bacillus sp. Xin1]